MALTEVVGSYLKREGFEVHAAYDGGEALSRARSVDPDVVVLDVGLPGIDGFEVCRRLRIFSDAYVIMLTARDTEVDTVVGLSVGADDYVTKPFSPRELVARIQAMQRRPRRTPRDLAEHVADGRPPRRIGDLCIDVDGRKVRIGESEIALTRTEFDLLDALSARPGKVLGRRQLIDIVWGDTWVGSENIVDVHVGHLRRKLGDDPTKYVTTVRGVGYRMGRGST